MYSPTSQITFYISSDPDKQTNITKYDTKSECKKLDF